MSVTTGNGAGAGASATLSPYADINDGQITITTGSAPVANDVVCIYLFSVAYSAPPVIMLSPGNALAASLYSDMQVYVSVDPSSVYFTIMSNSTPLAPSSTYIWNFMVGT